MLKIFPIFWNYFLLSSYCPQIFLEHPWTTFLTYSPNSLARGKMWTKNTFSWILSYWTFFSEVKNGLLYFYNPHSSNFSNQKWLTSGDFRDRKFLSLILKVTEIQFFFFTDRNTKMQTLSTATNPEKSIELDQPFPPLGKDADIVRELDRMTSERKFFFSVSIFLCFFVVGLFLNLPCEWDNCSRDSRKNDTKELWLGTVLSVGAWVKLEYSFHS